MLPPNVSLPVARTKIIATVGPASRRPDLLLDMIRRGVDVFRLNMAHGGRSEHEEMLTLIRMQASKLIGRSAFSSTWQDRRFAWASYSKTQRLVAKEPVSLSSTATRPLLRTNSSALTTGCWLNYPLATA